MQPVFKIKPTTIDRTIKRVQTAAATKGVEPLRLIAQSTRIRITANPASYLEFGPFWWCLKTAIRPYVDFGRNDDSWMFKACTTGDALRDAVLAWEYADFARGHFFAGTRECDLDNGQTYSLFDEDVEALALTASGRH